MQRRWIGGGLRRARLSHSSHPETDSTNSASISSVSDFVRSLVGWWSLLDVKRFWRLCEAAGVASLDENDIRSIGPRLPRVSLEHIESVFVLTSILVERADLVVIVYEWDYLQHIDYTLFPSLTSVRLQSALLTTIDAITAAEVPGAHHAFASVFFGPFLRYVYRIQETLWQSDSLAEVLGLLGEFHDRLSLQQAESYLTCVCVKFIHHRDPDIILIALHTITQFVVQHPRIAYHPEFEQPALFEQLEALGIQGVADLTDGVVALLTRLLDVRDIHLIYSHCIPLFRFGLDFNRSVDQDYSRAPLLKLLAMVVTKPDFMADFDVDAMGIVEVLLGLFPKFSAQERIEMGNLLANCMSYVNYEIVESMFSCEEFQEVLSALLEQGEDVDGLRVLIDGLYQALTCPGSQLLECEGLKNFLHGTLNGIIANFETEDRLCRTAGILLDLIGE
jgi:hypothetical protein